MKMNKCQQEFERWCKKNRYDTIKHPPSFITEGKVIPYSNTHTIDAWCGWKSAWETAQTPLNKEEIENIMVEIENESDKSVNYLREIYVIDIKTIRKILENPCLPGSITTREIKNVDK